MTRIDLPLATTTWDDLQIEQLASHATTALRKAKAQGRGGMVFEQISPPASTVAATPAAAR